MLFLTACGFEYGDGLLVLPKLPNQYITLQNKLDEVLDAGAFYASPDEGSNRQAVQLIDIDGDGVEEAIAFFREPGGQYRIYVYRRIGKEYVEMGFVEGYGSSIHSIYYPRIGSEGRLSLAVSWKSDETSIIGMTVYGINDDGLTSILELSYSAFDLGDTSDDGMDELFFVVRDTVTGAYYTRLYSYSGDGYDMISEAPLCAEARTISSIKIGRVSGEETALFVDSAALGGGYVTDVLKISAGGMMSNETIYPTTGSGIETWRSIQVFSGDIDGDGIIEIPSSAPEVGEGHMSGYNLIWYKVGAGEQDGFKTCHSVSDEWYLSWPQKWGDDVTAERSSASTLSIISFRVKTEPQVPEGDNEEHILPSSEVLRIYTFTGESRLQFYENQGVKRLGSQGNLTFGYMPLDSDFDRYELTDEEVRELFNVIEKKWSAD